MHRDGRRLLDWTPAALAVGIALVPTLIHGFPRGHDWLLELTRIAEYGHAVADGQLPPHWAPNVYGGRGAPVFLFYAPLYLVVAAPAAALLGSVTAGGVAAIWIFVVAGCLCLADLLRSLGPGDGGARIAVPLFVLHPYLLTDAFLRNANAELAALCLLPLPLAGVVRLARGEPGGGVRLAAGTALVVLAHNLTALVAATATLVLGAVLLWDARRRIQARFAVAFSTGLLLSAWLWLPALGYRQLVRLDELTRGKLDFHGNFGAVFGWSAYHAVGWLPALILAAAALWLIARRPGGTAGRLGWSLAAGAFLCLLLQQPVSTPVWEALPLLPLFQFPWRFQGPLALCTAVLAGIAWRRAGGSTAPRRAAEWLLLLLLVLNAWPHLAHVRPLPDEARDGLAAWTTAEGVRARGLKVTVGDEYLPAPGVDPAALPFGPDRVPPLRRAGLALAALAALGWCWVALRRRFFTAPSAAAGPPSDSLGA